MFNLVYRDGAPENTGHYENWETDGTTNLVVGTLVSISDGKAVRYTSGMPYGVVAIGTKDENTPSGDVYDHVGVLKIDSDMIFRADFDDPSQVSDELTKGKIVGVDASSTTPYAPFCFQITDVVSIRYAKTDDGVLRMRSAIIEGRFVEVQSE